MNADMVKNILISLLTAALAGAFTWIWKMDTRVAILEDNQLPAETVATCENLVDKVEEHESQLVNLWNFVNKGLDEREEGLQRLQAVETKIEIYHKNN